MRPIEDKEDKMIKKDFEEFIIQKEHPCIMAQAVFLGKHLDFHVYSQFGSRETAVQILQDIRKYLQSYDEESDMVYSFIAAFKDRKTYTEEEFEQLLWQQLQLIHEEDNSPWDRDVSEDPEAPNFSFSIGGKAFYMVGLHPNSSRKSRQAPYPAIAFNLHLQFENLRKKGRYEQVKQRIRDREIEQQGSLNPMLQDFNEGSEARQYSGRKVGEEWKCPFLHKKLENVSAEKIQEDR